MFWAVNKRLFLILVSSAANIPTKFKECVEEGTNSAVFYFFLILASKSFLTPAILLALSNNYPLQFVRYINV